MGAANNADVAVRVLLDTDINIEEYTDEKSGEDLNFSETIDRVKKEAEAQAMKSCAGKIADYLKTVAGED